MKHILYITLIFLGGSVSASAQGTSMSINYEVSCSKEDNIQRDHIQASDIGKTVVEHLNQEFELPQAIKLKFACSDDGEDSPYYDPEHKEVIVPYAFRRYVQEKLRRNEYSDDAEELRTVTDDVLLHTLYHEIGHALVDVLNLPITGKEEDAVDELSTVLLLESYEDGDEIAISAGEFFDIEALQTENVTEDALFGEHSLDEQRFFNILCLVYGENPEERTDLFEGLDINEERAEMCIDDFEKRNKAWATLLKLYRKPIE